MDARIVFTWSRNFSSIVNGSAEEHQLWIVARRKSMFKKEDGSVNISYFAAKKSFLFVEIHVQYKMRFYANFSLLCERNWFYIHYNDQFPRCFQTKTVKMCHCD